MHTRLASTLLLAAFVGACSDATTTNKASHPFTLSVTTSSQGALNDVTVGVGTSSLVITKAQLVARRIELAPVGTAACAGSGSDDDGADVGDGCAEVETGPTLIDLPLDASAKTSISAAVPAGTYRALELRVGPITSGNRSSSAFLSAHPEFENISVRIEGTFNGQPFVFTAPVDASIESVFSGPITIDTNNPNVTVAIDITSWFSDGEGGTLDPSTSSNASRISANIASSFHAFEDDDHDGHDDHHR
jgi:hypothetical protein